MAGAATRYLSRQTRVCRDKSMLAAGNTLVFVATKMTLVQQLLGV